MLKAKRERRSGPGEKVSRWTAEEEILLKIMVCEHRNIVVKGQRWKTIAEDMLAEGECTGQPKECTSITGRWSRGSPRKCASCSWDAMHA
eukprot:633003-Prymnesium_polylepis.2